MVQCLDRVVEDGNCNLKSIPQNHGSFTQEWTLSKLRQLLVHMNRWFDLFNSKDAACSPDWKIWITTENAISIADEFLEILKFFEDWRESLIDDSKKFHKQHFITDEAMESMRRCCYGAASLIYDVVIGRGIPILLCRINQDCCEMHFGHCRIASGSTNHPSQIHANGCARASHLKRYTKQTQHGNVTYSTKHK